MLFVLGLFLSGCVQRASVTWEVEATDANGETLATIVQMVGESGFVRIEDGRLFDHEADMQFYLGRSSEINISIKSVPRAVLVELFEVRPNAPSELAKGTYERFRSQLLHRFQGRAVKEISSIREWR